MRFNIFKYLCLLALPAVTTSCLDGDPMNMPPDGTSPIVLMTYNPDGGTTVNSGLQYFGNSALLYNPEETTFTATYAATIQGTVNKDVAFTIDTPEEALDDAPDKIAYQMLPDSTYEFVNTTATIKSGEKYAEFQIKFYLDKIDFTKDYMLPVTAVNDAGLPTSSNHGFVYFHVVGNPYAGAYVSTYKLERQTTTGVTIYNQVEDPKILIAEDKEILKQQAGASVFGNPDIKFLLSVNEDNTVNIESDPEAVEAGITITPSSTPSTYDPVNKTFHLYYEYTSSAGLYRRFSEKLVKK
ncbi:DUF1735 domain-containing protein [Cytophagaceae bacterium YF14B1]|uniref:DUF1735 domain-containing protein n=1 Tax=Xanthocytophaga flava TaxID=3048013 RepID=A0AAE3QNC3_9BACT|nr:DUF1735 domain-containing protein [Xanthocytophaga flavus]MDJ1480071.1 DUF1735 domain-containing protein [Xanthocytophaga flavus]